MKDAGFYSSLTEGDSGNGYKLCMGLGEGDFWIRIGGCQNLYCGDERGLFDFDNILEVLDIAKKLVTVPIYCEHSAGDSYIYLVRRVNRCGEEEKSFGAALRVSFDSEGNIIEQRCNEVTGLTALQLSGGKVLLLWGYSPLNQNKSLVKFLIYCEGVEDAIGEVEYYSKGIYGFVADGLEGDRFNFAVRGVDVDGNILDDKQSVSIDMKSVLSADSIDVEVKKL
jgi:hypothetical protein